MLLVLLIGLSLARGILFFSETMNPPGLTAVSQETTSPDDKTKYTLSHLPLFGVVEQAGYVSAAANAPETNLDLELQGVFISENPRRSTAIIAQQHQAGELFAIGDHLPGNAILTRVNSNHVLIKRGSRTEKLMFDDVAQRIESVPREPTSKPLTGQPESSDAPEPISESQQEASPTPARLEGDVVQLMQLQQANPLAGIPTGSSWLEGTELRPGDVILSINGQPFDDVIAGDIDIMQLLTDKADLEVQRGSRRIVLQVNLSGLLQ